MSAAALASLTAMTAATLMVASGLAKRRLELRPRDRRRARLRFPRLRGGGR